MPALVFRSSFPVLWRWTTTWCGVGGGVVCLHGYATGAPVPFGLTFGVALAIGSVYAAAVALFPVYVRPDGVRCYNFCGLYRTLRWDEMGDVWVEGLFGLRYAVVSSRSRWRQVWIPLYLSDMPAFARAVRAAGGDDNKLARVLARFDADPGAAPDRGGTSGPRDAMSP